MAGRGRKAGPTRMDMRRQNDAAEAQEVEKEEEDTDEDEDEDDDDEDEGAEGEAEEGADDEGGGDDDDEDAPKKKKKVVKKVVVKKAAPKRVRVPKEVRMKAVWVVLDNSSKRVGTFPFAQKKEAEQAMAKKLEDKPGFYIQLIKEPLE